MFPKHQTQFFDRQTDAHIKSLHPYQCGLKKFKDIVNFGMLYVCIKEQQFFIHSHTVIK